MSKTILIPIVGNRYRADGAALLPLLAEGTILFLDPEPSNPHDPDAVMVSVDAKAYPGFPAFVHLGYVPRSRGSNFGARQVLDVISTPDWTASLTFDMKGEPMVRLVVKDE